MLAAFMFACMVPFAIAVAAIQNYQCEVVAKKMGRLSDYGPIQGCMISNQKDGTWIPLNSFRGFE